MYDFAHCICDSLENISHSLCTLEFEIRRFAIVKLIFCRDLYFWILNELEMYKPVVFEFSRLNIGNNILSKRKIKQLVERELVEGWDDPRLLTLNGLKKRGYTISSLNAFIDLISVSRSGNENMIDMKILENCIRKELDESAPRLMAILEPVKLTLVGGEDLPEYVFD
jgi:glutaminyl-tRNA synthetase